VRGNSCTAFFCATAAGAFCINSASADATLKYRSIWHTTFTQSQNVLDTDGHIVAAIRSEGVVSLDGSVAVDNFTGTLDYTKGSGPTVVYDDITFSDGSALFLKMPGMTTAEGPRSTFKNAITIIGGKGRFAGAKGDGTLTGARLAPQPGVGAQLYGDITINIKN
jgi:hypothetical protein